MKNKLLLFLTLCTVSVAVNAQTGGPGQPEFMQFKPAIATDLVNPSTGTFSYNIPLFDVGGYPINLSYQSGIGMEDVASIVGLGWNINVGAITHTMRGLPDDFNGNEPNADKVTRTIHMRKNYTFGGNIAAGVEIAGVGLGGGLSAGMGIFYNNYNGYGAEASAALSLSMHKGCNASIGVGMKANSQTGVELYAQPSISLQSSTRSALAATGSLGGLISINSREGLKGSINASMSLSGNTGLTKTSGYLNKSYSKTEYSENPVHESIASASTSYSFSKTPEIPRISYPFKSRSYSGSFKAGGELFFVHPHGELRGYYTEQELSTNKIETPAYGYLYCDKAPASDDVLLDFNREKDQQYIKDASINIGIPYYTNDIYTVNAQGVGGSFQLNRGDIGVVFDRKVSTSGFAVNLGAELGGGNVYHAGAAFSVTTNASSSGKWNSTATSKLAFKKESVDDLYQTAYFKNASDVSVDINHLYNKLQGDLPVKVQIYDNSGTMGTEVSTLPSLGVSDLALPAIDPDTCIKTIRDPRTINIQYLTAEDASQCLTYKIHNYPINRFECSSEVELIKRNVGIRKPHHITEMTATNTDGMRYVFGLPTYNKVQKEVSFTLESSRHPGNDGLVDYNGIPTWGNNGKDGFYECTDLPSYVTSHLLTAVLSPDYIDVDNNGPSMKDVGNYVKINYSKSPYFYRWRTPYESNKATFNEAFLSDPGDNKASYVYGEKELWYTHSIESKTEIAEFYYDDTGRKDGLGVNGVDGGKDETQRLYKLDSIQVYSINERILKGNAAIPIRVINFNYNYELCNQINNSLDNSGKLTLQKVSIASGKSKRGLLSPYQFEYRKMQDGTEINRDYNSRNVNRFGNYQLNEGTSDININTDDPLSNIDFPYASQKIVEMTKNAYAWNLTKITLPSRGTVSVEYEPHSYAYTQDKRCMQMCKFENIENIEDLTDIAGYLRVKLTDPISANNPQANALLRYKYFNNDFSQWYYYKVLVELADGYKEWISGYCKISNAILVDNDHALIYLTSVNSGDDNSGTPVNPIRKNAWQFMRMNRPELCYGVSDDINGMGLKAFLKSKPLEKAANQIDAFLSGFNTYAAKSYNNFAASLEPSKSFIRLYSPNMNKIIGGSRVRRIISEDNWKNETDQASESKSYTIDYDYTAIENKEIISSGVMEYEPFNGQDENPLRQPVFMEQHIKMAPDNRLYVETPFNESLFPAPNLIYSKVKVTTNFSNINVPGQGYQEIESYTARDYPVHVANTDLGDNHEKKTNAMKAFAMSIFGLNEFHDYITLSQGFSITLNDMHGKQKATRNYNSQGALISSEQYEYKVGGTLSLIDGTDQVEQSDQLGISVSAICDSRTTEHKTEVTGINANSDGTVFGFLPAVTIVPLPDLSEEKSRINTVAFNKIIYKKGIMTKKTVTENGATVSTENVLFDKKTGFVVLTKTTNEFNDPLYKFHYPAHWRYDGLGAGYHSSDLRFSLDSDSKVSPDVYNVLQVGDQVCPLQPGDKFWITKKNANNKIELLSGLMGLADPAEYRVLHSGRKNLLMQEVGSVVSLANPIINNKISFTESGSSARIINASMQEFSDQRISYCNCDTTVLQSDCQNSPPIFPPGQLSTPPSQLPDIYAVKILLGTCINGISDPVGPWYPGSVIRWRIAIANIGVGDGLGCLITETLPDGFQYAGNVKYSYGTAIIPQATGVQVCATSPILSWGAPVNSIVVEPVITNQNLKWHTKGFPGSQGLPPIYFIIDYDVSVGATVLPSKYCNSATVAAIENQITVNTNTIQVTIEGTNSSSSSLPNSSPTINPYALGERGNWYPSKTWSYLENRVRNSTGIQPTTNIRTDGVFAKYKNFWVFNSTQWNMADPLSGWQWVDSVTTKDVNGLTVETTDVLSRHNALLTGYKHKLVVAEAGNAKVNEVFFDGFEDWNYLTYTSNCDSVSLCIPNPIEWNEIFSPEDTESHSGKYSGRLTGPETTLRFNVEDSTYSPSCIGIFKPIQKKKYVISAWVRDDDDPLAVSFDSPALQVGSNTFHTSGNIIDGWQRIYGVFTIPPAASSENLSFIKGIGKTWFDDIRIFPFDSKMTTHVYDGNTQKLTFTLDENNYFTKYNYDATDNLESINKETEKGVQTVKEARSANAKLP